MCRTDTNKECPGNVLQVKAQKRSPFHNRLAFWFAWLFAGAFLQVVDKKPGCQGRPGRHECNWVDKTLFLRDGGVDPRIVRSPARGNRLGLGPEHDRLLAVRSQVAQFGAA